MQSKKKKVSIAGSKSRNSKIQASKRSQFETMKVELGQQLLPNIKQSKVINDLAIAYQNEMTMLDKINSFRQVGISVARAPHKPKRNGQ